MNPPEKVCTHLEKRPKIDPEAYVAPGALILGDVTLERHASVWYQSVLRADIEAIEIGEGSNIQDGCVIHMASDRGTRVGAYVTVGHRAILHACDIEDEVLVGMGAIVMDGAHIGHQSIIAAGAVVTRDMVIPPGSLVVGTPARVVKSLKDNDMKQIKRWAEKYIRVSAEHREFHAYAADNVLEE
ncbi:MAG: gamma carbonic anhydrase family protein [Verrucomicrobiota bacterium]